MRRAGVARSVSGSGGWSRECPATARGWLSSELAAHRCSAAVWLETGSASRFRRARRGISSDLQGGWWCSRSGSTRTRGRTSRRCWTSASSCWARFACERTDGNASGCCVSRSPTPRGSGPSKAPAAWVPCWRSSSSPRARLCWTCRRSSRHGCGSLTTDARTRTTVTMLARRRSWGCATATSVSSPPRPTRRCCACWRNAITISPPGAPRRSVGCTPCWP